MLRVGINGFGRIGRAIFRVNIENTAFRIVAINDTNPSKENLKYLLKYDSTYGNLKREINIVDEKLVVGDCDPVNIYHHPRIDQAPWDSDEVDVIIDSSGVFENLNYKEALKKKGVKKLIVTNTPESENIDKYVIFGVNEEEIVDENVFQVSGSICDASAFGPVINVLNKHFEVEHGFLTTLHPWLNYQNLLDGPSRSYAYPGEIISNFALGRATTESLIPKTTSCVRATEKVIKGIEKLFISLSYRVPTPIVSSADMSVKLKRKTIKDEIISLFQEEQAKQRFKVFYNNFEPLISKDFIASDYSSIIDHRWTDVNDSNYLKMILWYDNEWAYSCRIVDLVVLVSEALK